MLKSLRKHTKLIIWIVVVIFILWGGFSVGISFQRKGRYAGEAFGKSISFQEFNRFYRAAEIFTINGESLNDPELLRQQAWRNILYAREAKHQKIEVTDDEVRKEIRNLFTRMGVVTLTPEIYENWIERTLRQSPQEFEKIMRDMLRIQKLVQSAFAKPVETPTREEALERFLRDSQKMTFQIAKFATPEEAKGLSARIQQGETWETLWPSIPEDMKETTPASGFVNFGRHYGLTPELTRSFFALKPGELSEAVPLGNQSALFYVLARTEAKPEDFTAGKEKEYVEGLTQERRQMQMLQWSYELLQRAQFKDYSAKSS